MSKNSLLLLLGGLVTLVSILGIPSSWKTIIFGVLGIIIIIITLLIRRDITTGALCMHLTEERQTNSYKQNGALQNKSNLNKVITEQKEEIKQKEIKVSSIDVETEQKEDA